MRILIIEDDRAIATNLNDYLTSRGHSVNAAGDGLTGLHVAVTQSFDVIVLDLSLPGVDGVTVCSALRNDAQKDTPILVLSARDTVEDKLQAFQCGADDYLVKPFALRELEARLTALYKRNTGRVVSKTLHAADLTFDRRTLTVLFAQHEVRLPPKCLRLLEVLMTEPGRVFSRKELQSQLWGNTDDTNETLRSHMHMLRRALVDAGGYDPIDTVHGLGYRISVRVRA